MSTDETMPRWFSTKDDLYTNKSVLIFLYSYETKVSSTHFPLRFPLIILLDLPQMDVLSLGNIQL